MTGCASLPGADRVFEREALLERVARHQVRIYRDRHGVPHVYGKTDRDVAYGLAFAHAEDDYATLEEVVLATRGELAAHRGRSAATGDFLVRWLGVWDTVKARYERDLTPKLRGLLDAYADGVNHYAALHPEQVSPGVLPVSGEDVAAGYVFRTPFFFRLDATLAALFSGEIGGGGAGEVGSNAAAVAPGRASDGATRLLVNSHQPWDGPVAWYEARVHSERGWDMVGGVFPGSPFILHGHGRWLGWAATVNRPDLIDVYRLEMDPENPDRYRFDGEWRELEVGEAAIPVKLLGPLRITVRRELLRSVHGPAVRTQHGVFALRFAGMGQVKGLQQYYRMNRAHSFADWLEAMRGQALPSLNFVYADAGGNIAYVYNAAFPRRASGYDWRGTLPGDTSETLWQESLPFGTAPLVVNPTSGFVISANHTPFRVSGEGDDPDPADFAPELGIETQMTNRARRLLARFRADPAISDEDFRAAKYDKRYDPASALPQLVAEVLAVEAGDDARLREAQAVLAAWDGSAELGSRGAALAIAALAPVARARLRGEEAPDPLQNLVRVADLLRRRFGRIDPTWGEVNRLRRGAVDLPLGGGPDALRAIEGELAEDGTITADHGDGLHYFVTWDARGDLVSESVHQFGSAQNDPTSPHHADQAPLFAAERTRRIPWSEAEIAAEASEAYAPGSRGHPDGGP